MPTQWICCIYQQKLWDETVIFAPSPPLFVPLFHTTRSTRLSMYSPYTQSSNRLLPVFYPPQISPERCAMSIKYHKYCHKNPFTSQKLPLNTPAPRLRHQVLKTIHSTDKYGLGEAGRIPAGPWEDGGILPEPWISTSFCIVETATSMAITKSMRRIGAKYNASRHPYV